MPVLTKERPVRVEFMAFGGGWVDATLRELLKRNPPTGMQAHLLCNHLEAWAGSVSVSILYNVPPPSSPEYRQQ